VLVEVGRFAKEADVIIGGSIDTARDLGRTAAGELIDLVLPEGITASPTGPLGQPVFPATINVPTAAIERAVAASTLIAGLPAQAQEAVGNALASGLAQGKNPRAVATMMREALGGNLTRALTISRTETLRSYREASREVYLANTDVLMGQQWISALDRRSCPACIALHGKVFPLDEVMAAHPNCRCTTAPAPRSPRELGLGDVPGVPPIEDGVAWFRRQDEATQRQILGPSKYGLFRSREITLPDLVRRRESPVWGPSTSEAGISAAKQNAAIRRQGGDGGLPTTPSPPTPPPAPRPAGPALFHPDDTVEVFAATRGVKKQAADEVRDGLQAIGEVLRLPRSGVAERITIKYVNAENYAGEYSARAILSQRRVLSSEIKISSRANNRSATFVHEYGHYMDTELLNIGTQAIGAESELAAWLNVVKGTRNYAEIRESSLSATNKAYFLGADELFARAFAQYVARKTGRTKLMQEVRMAWDWVERRHGVMPQWTDADFAPIEAALDDLFRKRGWLA
jgi:SPP1 gp7 family putative phage head morphogenesis protein